MLSAGDLGVVWKKRDCEEEEDEEKFLVLRVCEVDRELEDREALEEGGLRAGGRLGRGRL